MAHFAQLNENDIVIQVIVIHNNELLIDGEESEYKGILFCKSLYGANTKWRQTSYNGNLRKNYAGLNYVYDSVRDAFIPPQPYASWQLNEESCQWQAPVPHPRDGGFYDWDESTISWVLIDQPID